LNSPSSKSPPVHRPASGEEGNPCRRRAAPFVESGCALPNLLVDIHNHIRRCPAFLMIAKYQRRFRTLPPVGDAARRFFYGPGIENFDLALTRSVRIGESRSADLRVKAFNVLNHAQFYGPASVDGSVNDANFGKVEARDAPRLLQLAVKFHF
jgi:hypothetical protein